MLTLASSVEISITTRLQRLLLLIFCHVSPTSSRIVAHDLPVHACLKDFANKVYFMRFINDRKFFLMVKILLGK